MVYALDTNIIIHLLHNTRPVIMRFDEKMAQRTRIAIPPYVDYEIRRGLRYVNATAKERAYGRLCNVCEMGEMRRETWVCASNLYTNLRHAGYTVGDADIIIGAFCIVDGYTLVTNNISDFINMKELALEDWVYKNWRQLRGLGRLRRRYVRLSCLWKSARTK